MNNKQLIILNNILYFKLQNVKTFNSFPLYEKFLHTIKKSLVKYVQEKIS